LCTLTQARPKGERPFAGIPRICLLEDLKEGGALTGLEPVAPALRIFKAMKIASNSMYYLI